MQRLTMSHGIWVQQTPWMVYNMQSYDNVPFGMDAQMVSPGRCLMAYVCRHNSVPCGKDAQSIYNYLQSIYNQFTIHLQ